MNHQRVYDWLISRTSSRPLVGYCERHHIVPACLGGSDEKTNLVMLTAREHFLAHLLLAKIHGGKLWHAASMMRRGAKTSRLYEIARSGHALAISNALRGRTPSPAARANMSAAQKTAQTRAEVRMKHSIALTGFKHSQVSRDNMSAARTGVALTQEHRDAVSTAMTGKVKTIEHQVAITNAQNRADVKAKKSASMRAMWARRGILVSTKEVK